MFRKGVLFILRGKHEMGLLCCFWIQICVKRQASAESELTLLLVLKFRVAFTSALKKKSGKGSSRVGVISTQTGFWVTIESGSFLFLWKLQLSIGWSVILYIWPHRRGNICPRNNFFPKSFPWRATLGEIYINYVISLVRNPRGIFWN